MTNVFPDFNPVKNISKETNLGVEWANEIIKKSNDPMSIDQIRGKFDPSIPFQVKCVRDVVPGKNDTPYRVANGIPVGQIITITGLPDKYGHYPCDYVDHLGTGFNIHPSLEKWVLV